MSGTQLSSGTPADTNEPFQNLLNRLRDCHGTAVEGLQSKVVKLKRERCLDAQRLEEFYNKNQVLREQQKMLQESISVLKERLHSGPCDRCKETEKQVKKTQAVSEDQNNLPLISELKAERDILKEENSKLRLELDRLRGNCLQQTSFLEAEEGMIPDSPLQPMSFPVFSKMKRKREQSHVRYAEKPLSQPLPDLRKGRLPEPQSHHEGAVLVPETCDFDVMNVPKGKARTRGRTVVAETCRIDLSAEEDSLSDGDSPTLLNAAPKQTSITTSHQAVFEKSCDSAYVLGSVTLDKQKQLDLTRTVHHLLPHLSPQDSGISSLSEQGRQKRISVSPLSNSRLESEEQEKRENSILQKSSQNQVCSRPAGPLKVQGQSVSGSLELELVNSGGLAPCTPCKSPVPKQNCTPSDQSWSMDPGAALSQYNTESPLHPVPNVHTEIIDMDCTYVSHSVLDSIRGIGQKANDSLANIFDATAYGEYESCPQDEMSQNEMLLDHVPEKEGEDEEEHGYFRSPSTPARENPSRDAVKKNTSFACVEVVRKKHERRKLQGHTCKECEIYYADLPEEEKEKRLSSCSRHRFRYIPPSTPENFWETPQHRSQCTTTKCDLCIGSIREGAVGSIRGAVFGDGTLLTSTAVARLPAMFRSQGYIKEDNHADARMRRRRPYLATFSPKAKSSQK